MQPQTGKPPAAGAALPPCAAGRREGRLPRPLHPARCAPPRRGGPLAAGGRWPRGWRGGARRVPGPYLAEGLPRGAARPRPALSGAAVRSRCSRGCTCGDESGGGRDGDGASPRRPGPQRERGDRRKAFLPLAAAASSLAELKTTVALSHLCCPTRTGASRGARPGPAPARLNCGTSAAFSSASFKTLPQKTLKCRKVWFDTSVPRLVQT